MSTESHESRGGPLAADGSDELVDEVGQLRAFMRAILHHAYAHPEITRYLAAAALRGRTLKEAADHYARVWPGTRRLDDLPPRIRGAGVTPRPYVAEHEKGADPP
jgi:hypothetical protein